jgi:hypothetical protein
MAFTDQCDVFGAVQEEGINRVVRHLMRQRPSLFNYATVFFRNNPDKLCSPIDAAQTVRDAGNPLFTIQDPLPILGAARKLGVNFCVQFTDFQIDFHPGNVFPLPPELNPLPAQRFAARFRACVGLDCPSADVIADFINRMEQAAVANKQLFTGDPPQPQTRRFANPSRATSHITRAARAAATAVGTIARRAAPTDITISRSPIRRPDVFDDIAIDLDDMVLDPGRFEPEIVVLPTRQLMCVCLELFVVGHFEWGSVGGSQTTWLKPRLDGIEIVDLQPTPLENMIECYITTTLRLGILPRMIVPMETMTLNITKMLQEQGLAVGDAITLRPATVPNEVAANPSVENNELKVFLKLDIVRGGA